MMTWECSIEVIFHQGGGWMKSHEIPDDQARMYSLMS